jgi:predicted TIM-barrel fold metal-dependent hydrolase
MSWEAEVEELQRRRQLAREQGGAERVARQHADGKLTVRERIGRLADPGSFQEFGALTGAATYADGRLQTITPSPYVMGLGCIDGRTVAIGGEDFTVRGGSSAGLDRRKGGQGGLVEDLAHEYLARGGQALRPVGRPPPRRRPPRRLAAGAARGAGGHGLQRSRPFLPPALRRLTGLGRPADRRQARLANGGPAGGAGVPDGRAAAPAGDDGGDGTRGDPSPARSASPDEEIVMRVIDMECNVPRRAGASPEPPPPGPATSTDRPAGYGMANYGRIFRSRQEGGDTRPDVDLATFVKHVQGLGIVRSVPFGASNDEVAELLAAYPDHFIGLARISGLHGMRGVRELDRRVREQRFAALGVSALVDGIPASDRRYYPLYAKAVELDIPVRIYSSMNYATDRPYDLGHPRHLDQVAIDFPELTIIGGLGGWPWVNEMVALVRRHPRLYLDTSAHRARYLGQPGSGWEMLMQFGNTLIQDKVLVGLSAGLVGQPYETLLAEYQALPLKDTVKEKWLYHNAAHVFRLA